jgi:uncharacterized protein (DUF1330 family)
MSAYWIARVHVTDPEAYSNYSALAGPAIEEHGGVFLARAGQQIVFEGRAYERTVVARFPDLDAAERCYNSPEYAEARKYAVGAAERHLVAVEGID